MRSAVRSSLARAGVCLLCVCTVVLCRPVPAAGAMIQLRGPATPTPTHSATPTATPTRPPLLGGALRVNGNGTITDYNANVLWAVDDSGTVLNWYEAVRYSGRATHGGFAGWFIPEMARFHGVEGYSLFMTLSHPQLAGPWPNDHRVAPFHWSDRAACSGGDNWTDSPGYWSNTPGEIAHAPGRLGLDFCSGLIGGGMTCEGGDQRNCDDKLFVRLAHYCPCPDNPQGQLYGGRFRDNGDGTITDIVSGIMWARNDSGSPLKWPAALQYADNATIGGYTDWRIPAGQEMHGVENFALFNALDAVAGPWPNDHRVAPFQWSDTGTCDFPSTNETGYWTSTPAEAAHSAGRNTVLFCSGLVGAEREQDGEPVFVRLARTCDCR